MYHYRFKSVFLGILVAGLSGCASSEFNGASAKKKPELGSKEAALPGASGGPPAAKPDKPTIGFGEGGNACSRSGPARRIDLSIGITQDSRAQVENRYKGTVTATADVAESPVATFNINDISGNNLPVTTFDLDDMAMIVPANTPISSVLSCGGGDCTQSRVITVPAKSLLVYNANDPSFAKGSLDSDASTDYVFGAGRVNLPGDQERKRSEVAGLGIPGIAHNKITLKDLKARGFTDAKGNVAFKVFLVTHGFGFVKFVIQINPCK